MANPVASASGKLIIRYVMNKQKVHETIIACYSNLLGLVIFPVLVHFTG